MGKSVVEKQRQTGVKATTDQSVAATQSDPIDQPTQKTEPKPEPSKPEPSEPEPGKLELGEKEKEHGGCKGPEPTRYGDWEHNGRCTDF